MNDKTISKGQRRRNYHKTIRRGAEKLALTFGVASHVVKGRSLILARKRLKKLLQLYCERYSKFPPTEQIEFEWKRIAGMYVRVK